MKHKLGIIVPYRDRYSQLEEFKKIMQYYFRDNTIDYVIIIVEQDNAKLFNRGMLLNIGFKYAEKLKCDYVVFHDVDMLPVNVDYSYSNKPLHLATNFIENKNSHKIVFDTYFGGVTLFPVKDFKKINGFSNKYWGWGFEDDDLLLRCKKEQLKLNKFKIENKGNYIFSLKFNGIDSYVKCKNIFNLNRDTSIFVSFYPDEITCDHNKKTDTYTVFSIPGYDTAISYNSYSRYNFCTFDSDKNVLYVNSNIKTNYRTNFCVNINKHNKIITVYQDGEKIGDVAIDKNLMTYSNQKYFYLGVGNPVRVSKPDYFKGYIEKFVVFSGLLDELEIIELSNNTKNILTEDFGMYVSSNLINLYYDSMYIDNYKLVDLSKNGNDGEIVNCEISNLEPEKFKILDVPFRRKSLFKLLEHDENGFVGMGWKNDNIRWNQLRFYNEVSKNDELLKNDGLSDLNFIEHWIDNNNEKIIRIVVGI